MSEALPAGFADVTSPSGRSTVPARHTLAMSNGMPISPPDDWLRHLALQLKRGLDIGLGLLGLALCALPLLAIGLAVRLTSPGPVLFRQSRVGLGGRPFEMLKFRSVQLEETDQAGLKAIVEGDGRLTPIGGWLRATGLDELPQLWNVLRGEMSLVGPRPMVLGMLACERDYRDLVPYYDFRQQMPPGLSGLAQVSGCRGTVADERSAVRRIELDCAYIQNFSLGLDLAIIARSCLQLVVNIAGVRRA